MTLRLVDRSDHQPAEDLLEGLNEKQAEAVRTTEGPLLVIAGAGSGKTRVLTVRIAFLLRAGVHAHHVLALTFTNKAAQEMTERIGHLVGTDIARRIWAGTFHSIFARILRSHAERIGFSSTFTIYDTEDQTSAIKNVMQMLGISQQALAPAGVRGRISAAKNAMVSWQEYVRQADSITEKQTGQIFEEYEKRLRQSNAMDFDDLLINTIRLLENHPDVLESLQERFRYILVDEYQDTNRAQYRVVNLLAKKYKNLCVVGDDAQSIYRWRGADIKNILDFERDYPNANVVRLEQNYRSTKTILSAADDVIKNNARQLKKTLWTENAEGEKIRLLACRDDREEAQHIVRAIKNRMETHGYSYKDVAILYRTNAQSQALEDALRRDHLPYHIVSGVSFYKRKEVKDTIAYLRLLVNPDDVESLLRVVNEPSRGIGQTSLNRLTDYANTHGVSLYNVLQSVDSVPGIQTRTATAVKNFVSIVEQGRLGLADLPPATLAQSFIESTGLPTMYKLQDTEESLDRWNNIERVLDHILEQQELDEELTLAGYLEQVALVSEADDPELGNNRVAMMTMHAAKGLEFPLVVIAGLEQGLFPLSKAETDVQEQEEERRLFYVGITRAREQLILSYAERRYRFGELVFNRPSMFLSEIDSEAFTSSSRSFASTSPTRTPPANQPRKQRPARSDYSQLPRAESYSQIDAPSLKVGQRVKHPMFGAGTILSVGGSGQGAKATVEFSNGQRKQLMLAYARLEVL
jgi:DNA helicase II / ATP-dependent DNA helicase PcrA